MEKRERIEELVAYLNKCSDEYYNKNNPSISDAQFDALFDELSALERQTGYVLPNSPTQRAGYEVLSALPKTIHEIPLLSLAKTKDEAEVLEMAKRNDGYLALKLDGLTVKITYLGGKIIEAATRGDGLEGEVITHNAKVFTNIPKEIPYKDTLIVSGEAFIDIETFNRINESIENDEEKYSTPRNLAAGSVRQLDSAVCAARGVRFIPFNVLTGFDDASLKTEKLARLSSLGFELIDKELLTSADTVESTHDKIFSLKLKAQQKGYPIDGIVFSFDDIEFCSAQGKTGHHFKDGIAFKFGDPHFKTTLKDIIWNISRTGQLTPVAEFEAVEIDNTEVSRASLHNMTFVENLRLNIGDEILVSKRNMIIPHVEENLSYDSGNNEYKVDYPEICPVCKGKTTVRVSENSGNKIRVLYCENSECAGKQIKKYTHFVSKSAMNIEGLSESTLEKFVSLGFIKRLSDIFSLSRYREEIVNLEGFGEKSYNNLCESIEKARKTSLSNLLVAVNISLLGKNAARLIEEQFGSIEAFNRAIDEKYDFSAISGFGEAINTEIYKWFQVPENRAEFSELCEILEFKAVEKADNTDSEFFGKTVVITGTFKDYSRDELSDKMRSLGAKVTGSVSSKTDYLLCGENAGSKLKKAKDLGVAVISEEELLTKI